MAKAANPARWTESEREIDPEVERKLVFAALGLGGLLYRGLCGLKPTEEKVLFHQFQEQRVLDETASLMGKTRSQVRQLEQKALRKLQNSIMEVLTARVVQRQQLARTARGPLAD